MKLSTGKLNQAIERLSSGYKINSAKDNAANYYIASSMESKLSAYQIAEDNIAQGLDMITTASDTLTELEDKLNRLKALQTQVMNGGYGGASLKSINAEANAILNEIDRLHKTTEYNGINLFDSVPKKTADFQAPTLNAKGFIADIEYVDTKDMTRLSEVVDKNKALADGSYAICDLNDLLTLVEMSKNGYISKNDIIVLGADIDLKEYCEANIDNGGWTPISKFKGTFNGNGHTISNLKINRSDLEYYGLFTYLGGATVKNLRLENVDVVGLNYVGGLAGKTESNAIIENISVTGAVQGIGNVGGLVGCIVQSKCANLYSGAIAKGEKVVGGLAGGIDFKTELFNSFSTGDVYGLASSGQKIGGFAGGIASSKIIENIYATGNVYAPNSYSVGGLIGHLSYTPVKNCYSTGDVVASSSVGGIVGTTHSSSASVATITNAFASGTVNSKGSTAGGIVGNLYGTVENCTFKGDLLAKSFYSGGIAGSTGGSNTTIKNCSFEGTAKFYSTNCTGLIAGYISASASTDTIISDCQVVSVVEGMSRVFGATSNTAFNLTVENCTYNSYYEELGIPIISVNSNVNYTSKNINASDFTNKVGLQVGTAGGESGSISVTTSFMMKDLGKLMNIGLDLETDYLSTIDSYLSLISEKQVEFGATENRLMSALDSILANVVGLASSHSTIRDADMAELSSTYIQQQILQDASATMMAMSRNLRAESLIGIIQSLS